MFVLGSAREKQPRRAADLVVTKKMHRHWGRHAKCESTSFQSSSPADLVLVSSPYFLPYSGGRGRHPVVSLRQYTPTPPCKKYVDAGAA